MMNLLLQELRKPYGMLLPPAGLICVLLVGLWVLKSLGMDSVEQTRFRLATEWTQARKN